MIDPTNSLTEVDVYCPYCGEQIEIQVDGSAGNQDYIEDCRVCCQPIHLTVTLDETGIPAVRALREDDA
ncbi:MAG: CPXCG motif-containing cysteine-rich protein [Gammaproteobacteria bacterium]